MTGAASGVTALILCGGAGSRLGGVDKPLQPLAGRPLIEHVLERVSPQVSRIVISANRNAERYSAFGHPVVDDGVYRDCGPLAGLVAGLVGGLASGLAGDLEIGQTADLLMVPGDAPLLPGDLLNRLQQARASADARLAFANDGAGPQPLCCLVPQALLGDLKVYLDHGGRTPREWFARHAYAVATFAAWPRWAWSLNTAAEWQAAEDHLTTDSPSGQP